MRGFIGLIVVVALGGALAWSAALTPPPAPASSPATAFSAERAMADVRRIAAAPRPNGSPAAAEVRDYLTARLAGLGLQTSIQREEIMTPGRRGGPPRAVTVENVVGVLPGRSPLAPALLVMSHYDSVPGSPGAADDGAGVASALEIVRAIKAQGVPERDVIVLMTDGEEKGLCGAVAFFGRSPLARRVGFVVNMEARGGGGRAAMFETGRASGAVIGAFAASAIHPSSNSLASYIYSVMPNDTDFSVSKGRGLPGLNYAFIGRPGQYHTPSATPDALEQGALQSLGEQGLAGARIAAFADALPPPAPDSVWFDLFGGPVIAYPGWAGWLILAASAGLIVVAGVALGRRSAWRWTDAARGAGLALYLLLVGALALQAAPRLAGGGRSYASLRPLLDRFDRYEAALGLILFGVALATTWALRKGLARRLAALAPLPLLALGMIAGVQWPMIVIAALAAGLGLAVFGARPDRDGAWTGALALGWLLAAASQMAAPQTSFFLQWPVLAGAAGLAALVLRPGALGLGIAGIAAILVFAWAAGLGHFAALGVGAATPQAVAIGGLLAIFGVWPFLWRASEARPAPALSAAAAVAGAAALISIPLI